MQYCWSYKAVVESVSATNSHCKTGKYFFAVMHQLSGQLNRENCEGSNQESISSTRGFFQNVTLTKDNNVFRITTSRYYH